MSTINQSLRELLSYGRGVRCFINQPSRLQMFHDKHGQRCIAFQGDHSADRGVVDVYFTEGPVASMVIPVAALSIIYGE